MNKLRFGQIASWLVLLSGGCGGTIAVHADSGSQAADGSARADVGSDDRRESGAPDTSDDACRVLPPDAGIHCGQPCAFPGYAAPCPPDPGNPIGISCEPDEDGGSPIWICSEG
jgi:hypothetical protein